MAKIANIPENLRQQVMNWSAEGDPAQTIADKLKTFHNINCHVSSVYRLLNKTRKERQEVAKAKYAEEVEKTAGQDIKIMSDVIETYYKKWKSAKNDSDSIKIAAEMRAWIKDKMVLAGIDKDMFDHDAAKDEFIEELNKLKS